MGAMRVDGSNEGAKWSNEGGFQHLTGWPKVGDSNFLSEKHFLDPSSPGTPDLSGMLKNAFSGIERGLTLGCRMENFSEPPIFEVRPRTPPKKIFPKI